MPSPSRSRSNSPVKRKNSSMASSPKRKNSSVGSRSNKSVKSANNNKTNDNPPKKKVVNSSVGSRSNSSVKAPKRARQNSSNKSGSRSKSPEPRQKIKKNSSDKSNSSRKKSRSGSPQRNNNSWGSNNFGNRDGGDGDFRGRGRGRGRGDRGGFRGGRGGFGGGDRNNFNRDNNNDSWGNRDNNFNRNNNDNWGNNRENNFNRNSNNFGNRNDNFNRNDNMNNSRNNFSPSRQNSPVNRSPISPIKDEPVKKTPQQIRLEEFYNAHKEEGWFREKYNPISLISQDNERFLYIKKAQEDFLKQLESGFYNDISLSIGEYKSLGNLEFEENEDGEVDEKLMSSIVTLYLNENVNIEGPPLYGISKDSSTLFIPEISKEVYKYDIYEIVSQHEGFKNLIVNEPLRKADWKRMGWVEFEDEQRANQALEKLKELEINGKKLEFTKACKRIAKAKIVTNYPESRVEEELVNVIEIASKLDYEAKIYEKNPIYLHKCKSQRNKLELFLTYLRRVHFFDYFEGKFYDSFRTLTIKSGMTVLLVEPPAEAEIQLDELKKLDEKSALIKEKGSTEFRNRSIENIKIFTEIIVKKIYDSQKFNPQKDQQPKYWKCEECRKKFQTTDHLAKHMISRHEDLITEEIESGMMKIYLKNEEEYEKTRAEREAKEDREEKRRKRRPAMKDFDCPEEEEDEEIRRRLRPVSNTKKLINFLDI